MINNYHTRRKQIREKYKSRFLNNKRQNNKKRDYRSLDWSHYKSEEYDTVRHFVEMNNSFPNNTVFTPATFEGVIGYQSIYDKLINMGAELLLKTCTHNQKVRQILFEYDNSLITIESVYVSKPENFLNVPDEYKDGTKLYTIGQITIYHKDEIVPSVFVDLIKDNVYKADKKPSVGLISRDNSGFFLNEITLDAKIMTDEDLSIHYGDDFPEFYESYLKRMGETNKGISLLHGVAGSGKSYLINKLVSDLTKLNTKKVILVPTNIVSYLLEPEFNSFLLELVQEDDITDYDYYDYDLDDNEDHTTDFKKGMILILEDAEPVLQKRENSMNAQSTSNILNLTDGMLNDIFKIQVIATYNTDDENIDEAITRDMRLIAKRKFENLSIKDSQRLIDHLEVDYKAETTMSVASIYALLDKEEDNILIDHKREDKKSSNIGLM